MVKSNATIFPLFAYDTLWQKTEVHLADPRTKCSFQSSNRWDTLPEGLSTLGAVSNYSQTAESSDNSHWGGGGGREL